MKNIIFDASSNAISDFIADTTEAYLNKFVDYVRDYGIFDLDAISVDPDLTSTLITLLIKLITIALFYSYSLKFAAHFHLKKIINYVSSNRF